ncbi:MAG: LamG-like jellyroll fold domain-containing protein [Patescibacteria group bacterium]
MNLKIILKTLGIFSTVFLLWSVFVAPVFAADIQLGNVINLNGTDGFVNVPNNSLLEPVDEMSFEIWAYQDNWLTSTVNSSFLDRSDYGSSGYALYINRFGTNTVSAVLKPVGYPGFLQVNVGSAGLASGWHHFAATFDGQFLKFYIDGVLADTEDAGASYDIENIFYHQPLWFGKRGSDNAFFSGKLDEARIYSKALTSGEITVNYNSGLGDFGSATTSLVGAWHFDEGTGTSVADYSGNGLTGSLSGGATWAARTIPPNSISNLSVASFGTTTATITWDTSEDSDSIVHYGLTSSYGSTVMSSTTDTSHSLNLTGLTATTTYHFKVYSFDGSIMASSSDATFKTLDFDPTDNIFYAAPNGRAQANGAIGSPWDLYSALGKSSIIQPGGTLYLRGGTYLFATGSNQFGYTSTLAGTADDPITVRSYPGEWAVLDGTMNGVATKNTAVVTVNSDYTWYQGFEITNSETASREIYTSGSNPSERRGNSIDDYGDGNKLINLVIHDTGQGIGGWANGRDNEYYGNIIYNNGWDAPDRTHGHNIYTQNDTGWKRYLNNIVVNAFGVNVQMYGSGAGSLRNFSFEGNSWTNSGILLGGNSAIDGLGVFKNYFYNIGPQLGYDNTDNINIDFYKNYIASSSLSLSQSKNVTVKYNTIIKPTAVSDALVSIRYDATAPAAITDYVFDYNTYYKPFADVGQMFYSPTLAVTGSNCNYFWFNVSSTGQTYCSPQPRLWQEDLGYDLHGTHIASAPTEDTIFYRKNKYDDNRMHVTAYNWDGDTTVSVDPSLVLDNGDTYELRNSQNYFDDVITGTYNGSEISIDMSTGARSLKKPIGYDEVIAGGGWYHNPLQPSTFPIYGVFVLVNTGGTVDVAKPIISNITHELVSPATTTIFWETNEDATTRFEYGLTSSYGSASTTDTLDYNTPYTTFHKITLRNLSPETLYHYRLVAEDYSGNSTTSQDYTFLTSADITPPVLSSGSPSGTLSAGTTGATLSLDTNEASTCKFGTVASTAYASIGSTFTTTGGTTHSESLTGLSAGSYTYYVRCTDGTNPTTSDYTITFTIAASTGGGGGSSSGGSSRRTTPVITATTTATTTVTTIPLSTLGPCTTVPLNTPYSFREQLTLGSRGEAVRQLQIFLNTYGYTVSLTGPGSKGQESTYFGPATVSALVKFQLSKGITPAIGFFGPLTMQKVNLIIASTQTLSFCAPVTTSPIIPVSTPTTFVFTRNLTVDSEGADVKALQIYLNTHGFPVATSGVGSPGNETSYFGYATKNALIKFQLSKGIVPASGFFGPITRSSL